MKKENRDRERTCLASYNMETRLCIYCVRVSILLRRVKVLFCVGVCVCISNDKKTGRDIEGIVR